MIPSKRWFPRSVTEQSWWIQNFAAKVIQIGPSLGLTPAEITQMTLDAEDFRSIADTTRSVDAFRLAVVEFRLSLAEARIGSPTPVFPAITFSAPPNAVPAGIFQRVGNLVRRIRASPNYTDETGALLGIVPSYKSESVEEELKPALKALVLPGGIVQIAFTRGQSDGISIELKLDKDAEWTSAGRFFKSPIVLTIPNGNGLPRAVQLRARYLDGNSSVGQNSNVVNVVTLP
jgi:hypothetical protein